MVRFYNMALSGLQTPLAVMLQRTLNCTDPPAGKLGKATPPGLSRLAGVAGQLAPPLALHESTLQADRPASGVSLTSAPSALAGPRLPKLSV